MVKRLNNAREFHAVDQNLQDLFLNTVRKQKISLTIFLING
ncbi:RNA chaperone Hfq, partial [Rhizobium leguminosarum]